MPVFEIGLGIGSVAPHQKLLKAEYVQQGHLLPRRDCVALPSAAASGGEDVFFCPFLLFQLTE